MIPYFEGLGRQIERAWVERSYEEEIFPEIAREALERNPPHEHVQPAEIIDWVFGSTHELLQPNGPLFGEPPVMLFQAPRFYIEALFWLAGTTDIHQHAFSGVFAVLAGSSVHSHWSFLPERVINSRLLCGRLERVSTEILKPGGIRLIRPGDQLIHQLFHLDLPSVTVVIRTTHEPRYKPQYKYLLPGLAIDHEDSDGLRTRRLLFLDGMARGHMAGLREHACTLIGSGDLEALYAMFSLLTRRKVERSLLDELYRRAIDRHGEVVELFRRVCEEERRTRIVSALRAKVHDPHARFLLALLMLMPDREAIYETIRLQYPGSEPLDAIETWVESMSGKETIGFDFKDANRVIFRGLVEGMDVEGLMARLRAEFREDSLAEHRDRLLGQVKRLASSDLFLPLLSESPLRQQPALQLS